MLRGSYGIFYDRPFDNLWQNIRSNSFVLALFSPGSRGFDYLVPRAEVLAAQRGKSFPQDFPNLTVYQPGLRDAYAQSYFVGLERRVSDTLFIEVNGTGTLGRKLITTDLINRPGGEVILNNRADLLRPAATDRPAQGGRQLLEAASFSPPAAGMLGNTGRNAFRGPGLFNIDLSLSRSFRLPFAGERLSVAFRADAFNLLNHANLNNPDPFLDSETFGVALYGRRGRRSGFPALAPFDETARQVQLLVRIEF